MNISKIAIILVAPQMGENIGATARAMKNFGIKSLRIVNPRDGWPNPKAESMAVGAVEILHQAKLFDNLNTAIADIEYLYATTATPRHINKDYILSRNLYNHLVQQHNYGITNVGIMFGRENCGLNNQEITMANRILSIDTSDFSSLNIAQAVGIICYELFQHAANMNSVVYDLNNQELATKEDIKYFFEHLFTTLDQRNFFKIPEKRIHMMQNIMNIFTRIDKLSKTEVKTLRGIISSYTKS